MKYLKGLVRHNSLENRPVAVTAGPLVRKPRRFKVKGMIFQQYAKSKTAASFKLEKYEMEVILVLSLTFVTCQF